MYKVEQLNTVKPLQTPGWCNFRFTVHNLERAAIELHLQYSVDVYF